MKINRDIIRGYDIRGRVGVDLTEKIMELYGKAYGTYMARKNNNLVIIGRDSRLKSESYKDAFIKGVISTGVNIIDIGLVLVGRVYWAQHFFKSKAAAMITASHNPKEYNGMKVANDYSEAMMDNELNLLTDMVEKSDFNIGKKQGNIEKRDITEEYFSDLIRRFNIKKSFKIVVDPSCSTAGVIVPNLLRRIGCEVIESNCKLDGNFPLGPADPTEVIVAERLRDTVLKEKADIGFSYDTDGDRIGIVDEKGTIIWNDVLVALFAIDVLDKHPGKPIMFNTLCSKVVTETIEKYGGIPFMWRTGHGFLKKKNQVIKAPFIGELSGHFFFSADFYNHDDGCYATLRLLDYLGRTNQSLHQAISKLPKYISCPEIKVYCAEDKKRELIKKLSPTIKKDFPEAEVIDDERAGDGLRLEQKDSMFVIRYSQNGPYLTIKFEAKTQDGYDQLKTYINNLLQQYEEIEWNHKINVNIESLIN